MSIAIALLAGFFASPLPAGVPSANSAVVSRCDACFASPISTLPFAASDVAVQPALGSYSNVVLNHADTWDARTQQNVQDALALLPASVRNELGNPAQGPIVLSVNNQGLTLDGDQPYGAAANFFSTDDGRNEVVLYPGQSARTILHELGHAYNLRNTPGGSYGLVYLDPEMRDFMRAASWRLLTPDSQVRATPNQDAIAVALDAPMPWTNLSHNDPLEDFANSFAYYFASPDQLAQLSPARYDWFAAHLPR